MIGKKQETRPAAGGTYVRNAKTGTVRPVSDSKPAQAPLKEAKNDE